MLRFYDKAQHRLVYLKEHPSPRYWDAHWGKYEHTSRNLPKHRYFQRITRKYLVPGATLLEGGCGLGTLVHALDRAGFNVYGVDFAEETVRTIQQ